MTIDTQEFSELLSIVIGMNETGGKHYLRARGEFIAHIDAQLLAARAAGLEEAAKVAETIYRKDAFRFEIGTEAAKAIRALATQAAPTQAAQVCAKCGKPRSDHTGTCSMMCRNAIGQTFEPATQAAQVGGVQAAIDCIADELEAEALNYEGDFADTVKGCVEALRELAANPAPSAAPARPSAWKVLDENDKPDTSRLLDVILRNGVCLMNRQYSKIDWTQVADWRYAAPSAQQAEAPSQAARAGGAA